MIVLTYVQLQSGKRHVRLHRYFRYSNSVFRMLICNCSLQTGSLCHFGIQHTWYSSLFDLSPPWTLRDHLVQRWHVRALHHGLQFIYILTFGSLHDFGCWICTLLFQFYMQTMVIRGLPFCGFFTLLVLQYLSIIYE